MLAHTILTTCSSLRYILAFHRMAGHQIALLRILRLKPALQATVTSPEFKDLCVFEEIARVLLKDEFWVYLFLMCRALYAPMRVLRLADQKVAAMDKLHFFVCQANSIMPRYLAEAEHHSTDLLTAAIEAVLADETDLASEVVDAEDDDGSDVSEVVELEEEAESDDEDMVSTTALMYINILMLYFGSKMSNRHCLCDIKSTGAADPLDRGQFYS